MRKILELVFLLLFLAGCGRKGGEEVGLRFRRCSDLNRAGLILGISEGTAASFAARKAFPLAELRFFSSKAEGYEAVRQKQIAAYLFDRHELSHVEKQSSEFRVLPDDFAAEHIAIAVAPQCKELLPEIDRFIRRCQTDGTYLEMYTRWILSSHTPVMPKFPALRSQRKLRVVTEGHSPPMNYFDAGGNLTGFDVELAHRLARALHAELELSSAGFPAMFSGLQAGKYDLVISSVNRTGDREANMLFSRDYFESAITALIHADSMRREKKGIFSLADLKEKKAGCLKGTPIRGRTNEIQPGILYQEFDREESAVQALLQRKLDGVLLDDFVARMWCGIYPDRLCQLETYSREEYVFLCRKNQPIAAKISRELRKLKRSGELRAMTEKWCDRFSPSLALEKWQHKKDYTGIAGTLRCVSDVIQPNCFFLRNGAPAGLDCEILNRIAYELNMKFEFRNVPFIDLFDEVESGKADVGCGGLAATEARKQIFSFTECYYDGGLTLVTLFPAKPDPENILSLMQLSRRKVGLVHDPAREAILRRALPRATQVFLPDTADLASVLASRRLPAILVSEAQAQLLRAQDPTLRILQPALSRENNVILFPGTEKMLREDFYRTLRSLETQGTLAELRQKWFAPGHSGKTLPPASLHAAHGTLRFAAVPQSEPFVYESGGRITGFEIDLVRRIASALGYDAEAVAATPENVYSLLRSGEVRFAVGGFTESPAQKANKLLSLPDYRGGIVLMTKAPESAFRSAAARMNASFREKFRRVFILDSRWKLMLSGLGCTLMLSLSSAAAGILLGFAFSRILASSRSFLRETARHMVSFLKGTPVLVLLLFFYYVLFARLEWNAWLIAAAAFSLHFAARTGELFFMLRDRLPVGEFAAARALGFSERQLIRYVVFPQALKYLLPALRREFLRLLKSTAVVGYLSLVDLTRSGDLLRAASFETLLPLFSVALGYWLLIRIFSLFFALAEHRFVRGPR